MPPAAARSQPVSLCVSQLVDPIGPTMQRYLVGDSSAT
jgi:hypothetical protein